MALVFHVLNTSEQTHFVLCQLLAVEVMKISNHCTWQQLISEDGP